jgi:hypothetical protein
MTRNVAIVCLLLLFGTLSLAGTISKTGTFATPEDTEAFTLILTSSGNVTLQTYGFGGGTNAAGTLISPGGFDPFVGLFAGTGLAATLIDGTSEILTNYTGGCPPAGTVSVGSLKNQCGDVTLQFKDLAAGAYTVFLTEGEYLPNAVFESPLGDGFTDLTAGVFQTCEDANNRKTDTGAWALDITTAATSRAPAPADTALVLLSAFVLVSVRFAGGRLSRKPRTASKNKS